MGDIIGIGVILALALPIILAIALKVGNGKAKRRAWELVESPNPSAKDLGAAIKKLNGFSLVKDDERPMLIDRLMRKLEGRHSAS